MFLGVGCFSSGSVVWLGPCSYSSWRAQQQRDSTNMFVGVGFFCSIISVWVHRFVLVICLGVANVGVVVFVVFAMLRFCALLQPSDCDPGV